MDGPSRYQVTTNDAVLATTGWSALDLVTKNKELEGWPCPRGSAVLRKSARRGVAAVSWTLQPVSPSIEAS